MKRYLRWLNSIRRRLEEDRRKEYFRHYWWDREVIVDLTTLIFIDENAVLVMGRGTVVGPYTILHLQNDALRADNQQCRLTIGERTAINEFCNIRASGGEIIIGNDCLISQFVSIIATNHGTGLGIPIRDQPWDSTRKNVTIGDDVWIGANVVITPGVTIGSGSVIGAGSVVTRDIPSLVIAAGVPARVIRPRS